MLNNTKKSKGVFAHITVGIQLAATMLVFIFTGYRLDLYYDMSPVFITIGMVLGFVIGFYSLLKELLGSKKTDKKSDRGDKKIKWM